MGAFGISAAIGANVPKLTIFTHSDHVFGYIPVFFKIWVVERFLKCGVFDVTKTLRHGGAIADVAINVYGDFFVKAGVVVEGFGETLNICAKIFFFYYTASFIQTFNS